MLVLIFRAESERNIQSSVSSFNLANADKDWLLVSKRKS